MVSNSAIYTAMARAAAEWWTKNLDPAHGLPFLVRGDSPFTKKGLPFIEAEKNSFENCLSRELIYTLTRCLEEEKRIRLQSLRVVGMNHSGLLADVAEQADLSGIIFHLPRCEMTLDLEACVIRVNGEIIWPAKTASA